MTGSKVTSLPPSPPISISHFLGQPPPSPSTSLADSFHDSAGQEAEEGASGTKLTLPLFPRKPENPTPPPTRASPALPDSPRTLCTLLCHTATLPHSPQAAVSEPTIGLPAGLHSIRPRHWPASPPRTPHPQAKNMLRPDSCSCTPLAGTSLETWIGEPGAPHVLLHHH